VSDTGRLGIGPSAREFREAFGVGADEGRIHPVDGVGVALAGIQGLNELVQGQASELARLRQEIEAVERTAASGGPPAPHTAGE
jgi:hypothetical protein